MLNITKKNNCYDVFCPQTLGYGHLQCYFLFHKCKWGFAKLLTKSKKKKDFLDFLVVFVYILFLGGFREKLTDYITLEEYQRKCISGSTKEK